MLKCLSWVFVTWRREKLIKARDWKKALPILLAVLVIFSALLTASGPVQATTEEEMRAALELGMEWLADQQNPEDGSWAPLQLEGIAKTGFAVVLFETYAIHEGIDPLDSAFEYYAQVREGLDYIFLNTWTIPIEMQTHGDPDTDHDGIGVGWGPFPIYETGVAMMAIGASTHPEMVVNVPTSGVDGWTYQEVLQDAVDYMAWAQAESHPAGGWGTFHNWPSNNRASEYAVLGLAYAQAASIGDRTGFGCVIPAFVMSELSLWIEWIQNDVGPSENPYDDLAYDGGSGFDKRGDAYWVDTHKTGNLLFEMAFCGDTLANPRVTAAVDYISRHWYAADYKPGWRGPGPEFGPYHPTYRPRWPDWPACYQAMYCLTKGFDILGVRYMSPLNDPSGINWQEDFSDVLITQQNPDGSWPNAPLLGVPERHPEPWVHGPPGSPYYWDTDQIQSTAWALLTLQTIIQPPPVMPTALGSGWGWMRIAHKQYVYGRAELYKIEDEQIELVISSDGSEYSRTWNVIFHREPKHGETYLCYSREWGFLIVGLHRHRRGEFWFAFGRGVRAFGFKDLTD